MAGTFHTVANLDTLANALGQAWARVGQRQFEPLAKWQLIHIDQSGEVQHAMVDVLEAMPLERLVLVRCSPDDEPLVIKIERIVQAVDVPSRRKVMLDAWLAQVQVEGEAAEHLPNGLGPAVASH